ncbi:MAG: FAD-dependent thymidylate synthase [Oscillospiraceae bacterium]|nr:FAD-dependent thymidylate synthase [Oscillospiraceae bacterium]
MPAKVFLIAHSYEPVKTVAQAAKLCYSSSGIEELGNNLTPEKARDFVEMLVGLGHESPLEHASFTFGIEGISRAVLAQFTRHRIASYSVKSQRYVSEKMFDFVIPPEIEKNAEAKEIYLKSMQDAQAAYDKLAAILATQHTKEMVAEGQDEKSAKKAAEKLANEDARFVLPNACETKMVVTMNTRSLLNFFKHRCCNRAQWEIREVAEQMLREVCKVAPELFTNAGPACAHGPCCEGKMTCGKAAQMRAKYNEILNK